MARQIFSARGMPSRKSLLTATFLSLVPVLGGCVSAVDETSAFGFAQTPEPSTIEGVIAENASSAEGAAGGKAEGDTAGQAVADASTPNETTADRVASTAESTEAAAIAAASTDTKPADDKQLAAAESDGGIRASDFLTRTSGAAVAAYASPAKKREADSSLYASLYNQSNAKTPLRNAEVGKSERVVVHQRSDESADPAANALPGVDPKSLFEIGQRASVDSDLMEDIGSSYQLASLSGIARLAPSGLMVQRDDIVTNCFDSNLMNLIGQIERRFKQRVVITSGYRSPSHNRRVNGAKASMHMACKAADLHVPGVNGQEVARFVRALPGRGGVGTYCHTAAIHIDVGRQRDWNWPCRRRQST